MGSARGENLIFTKIDHRFVMVGLPSGRLGDKTFFIKTRDHDALGPMNLDECRRRFPDLVEADGEYDVVERLPHHPRKPR